MGYKLFVDADVVIDFFTDREPHANPASQLFELSEQGEVKIYLSAVSINKIYYIVRKFKGHKRTLEIIELLLEMTDVIGTSKAEIQQAIKSDFSDFEDAVQHASALTLKGMDAIITRNIKDYKHARIAVLTPLTFLKMRGNK